MPRAIAMVFMAGLGLTVMGCEQVKSANPLSPSIAGPIPGVNITAPQSLEPLLELHERDRANGLLDAPWPPVYPKQPNEPPRVAPSRARRQE